MKRFMVVLGLGSLLFIASATIARAEYPVSVINGTPISTAVTWHTDLQSGWREAKRRNVPMVIFITTDQCIYCDAMKQNTWCNASVQARISQEFVAIRLNKHRNQKTLSRIKVTTYPTTLIGTPNGKVIGHRIGYQPPNAVHAFFGEARSRRINSAIANSVDRKKQIH